MEFKQVPFMRKMNSRKDEKMKFQSEMMWIVGACLLVLAIVLFKNKIEIVLNFVLRAVLGMIGLYLLNFFLTYQGISAMVGVNPITVSTVGVLGVSGFALLYGISFYNML